MKKIFKWIPKRVLYVALCMVFAGMFVLVVHIRGKVNSIGNFLGETVGTDAGKVMGSFEAMADYKEAYAEGREEGLSARDTAAEVVNKIQEISKLEVLSASVKLNDVHSIGEGRNLEYAALYLLKGNAVFTADLSKAEIRNEGNRMIITLPEPEMELFVDQRETKKVAEYQKHFFSGSAEDGFDAYLSSMDKIANQSKETVANYDALMEMARESARKQVEQLVMAVSVPELEVEIEFQPTEVFDMP